MRKGTPYAIAQLDNASIGDKVSLRRRALRYRASIADDEPFVLEAYAGLGRLWSACYRDFDGIALEKDENKCYSLARMRPTWPVYQVDTPAAIQQGILARFPCTFLDFDAYGAPWPAIEAFFVAALAREMPDRLDVVATDGGGLGVRFSGAWQVPRFQPYVQRYGASKMFERYPEVCREMIADLAAPAGYELKQWLTHRAGRDKSMLLFWAGMERL